MNDPIIAPDTAPRQDAASNRLVAQLRKSQEARGLAIRLHLADVRLCRVPDQQWAQIARAEQEAYLQRGALVVNLGDPLLLRLAAHTAAQAVAAQFDGATLARERLDVSKAIATTVLSVLVRELSKGWR